MTKPGREKATARRGHVASPGRYRRVQLNLHADPAYRELTKPQPNGQTLFLHLLAGPLTTIVPGLLRAGVGTLSDELQWPLEATRDALDEITRVGLAEVDASARLIFVRRALEENLPPAPNVIRSWRHAWNELPECSLKRRARAHFEDVLKRFGQSGAFLAAFREITGRPLASAKPTNKPSRKTPLKVFRKASPKASAIQDQDQEQDQEQEQDPFDVFYSNYPRQQNREEARQAWIAKGLGGAHLPEILEAIRRQATWPQWTKDEGQFIPNPAKWLTNGSWHDEQATFRPVDTRSQWSLEGCPHDPKCYNRGECAQKDMLAAGRAQQLGATG